MNISKSQALIMNTLTSFFLYVMSHFLYVIMKVYEHVAKKNMSSNAQSSVKFHNSFYSR
jgi:hypothetical protein